VLRLLLRTAAAVLVVALLYVASVPVRIWADARGQSRTPVDAVVVLGAAQYDGRPSPVLEARLRKARALYEDDVAPVIVTVGGKRAGDRTTEAQAGQAWLTSHRVPADDVLAVAEGSNTQDSLAAVGRLLDERGWDTAVVVTDPWHTFRSKALARDVGIEATSAPVASGPAVQSRVAELRYVLRETAAYLQWRVTGETGSGGPAAL
jgi:uncharacterized SAM-binding protein YcdF (DUF218 family)